MEMMLDKKQIWVIFLFEFKNESFEARDNCQQQCFWTKNC